MKKTKLVTLLGLSALGMTLAAGAGTIGAYTNYSIAVPQTTSNSKPNAKDNINWEMVSHPSNAFASAITATTEGPGTVMTQWMEIRYGTANTAHGVDVKQFPSTTYYHSAHIGQGLIKGTSHNITSENNNFNAKAYSISGSWSADSSY